MVNVDGVWQERINRAQRWEKDNPGLSWCNQWHPEDDPKINISKAILE